MCIIDQKKKWKLLVGKTNSAKKNGRASRSGKFKLKIDFKSFCVRGQWQVLNLDFKASRVQGRAREGRAFSPIEGGGSRWVIF